MKEPAKNPSSSRQLFDFFKKLKTAVVCQKLIFDLYNQGYSLSEEFDLLRKAGYEPYKPA
jgi:hypothetical protein